jgi:Protein of unknown function (DUF3993)
MRKITVFLILMLFSFLIGQPVQAYSSKINKEQIFNLLQNGFNAQLSLGEGYQTYEEAIEKLSPYFSDYYISLFLKENLVKEKQGYTIYGTDFALYYIPYFTYSDQTKIVSDQKNNKVFIYEFFQENGDGPVSYGSHYEIIELNLIDGKWKINNYEYSEQKPSFLSQLEKQTEKEKTGEQLLFFLKIPIFWTKQMIQMIVR